MEWNHSSHSRFFPCRLPTTRMTQSREPILTLKSHPQTSIISTYLERFGHQFDLGSSSRSSLWHKSTLFPIQSYMLKQPIHRTTRFIFQEICHSMAAARCDMLPRCKTINTARAMFFKLTHVSCFQMATMMKTLLTRGLWTTCFES